MTPPDGRKRELTRGDEINNVVAFPARCPVPDTTVRPAHPIGNPRGRWAYSTGDDGDGYPRGVYKFEREGWVVNEWLQLGPLPYVLKVLENPSHETTRFRVLYYLSMRPDADPADVEAASPCTIGEIRSGRWNERTPAPVLSADPPIIRAVARAILEIAEQSPRERRGQR